jgi:hypothetical protein
MTEVVAQGSVGPDILADGAPAAIRLGRGAEQIVSELHGRFYEQTFRGNVYSDGMGLTSISNATFTVGGIGATTTPITGVFNPTTSTVNLVIIQAMLAVTVTVATATGCGGFVWATSVGNTAISTGSVPLNRRTLVLAGAQAKGMTNVALTGITNNVAVRFASVLNGGLIKNISSVETAVGQNIGVAVSTMEIFDGALIVPPGGVLALLATTTPVAHSAASGIVWEEVPL